MAKDDVDREELLKEVPIQEAKPSEWPKGVRSIGMDELDAIGVNKAGSLYFHGKKLKTVGRIELTFWQGVLGFLVAAATVAQAVAAWLPYIK